MSKYGYNISWEPGNQANMNLYSKRYRDVVSLKLFIYNYQMIFYFIFILYFYLLVCFIFNRSLFEGVFPHIWKISTHIHSKIWKSVDYQ